MDQLQTENSTAGGLFDLTDVLDAWAKNAHIRRVMSSSDRKRTVSGSGDRVQAETVKASNAPSSADAVGGRLE